MATEARLFIVRNKVFVC